MAVNSAFFVPWRGGERCSCGKNGRWCTETGRLYKSRKIVVFFLAKWLAECVSLWVKGKFRMRLWRFLKVMTGRSRGCPRLLMGSNSIKAETKPR